MLRAPQKLSITFPSLRSPEILPLISLSVLISTSSLVIKNYSKRCHVFTRGCKCKANLHSCSQLPWGKNNCDVCWKGIPDVTQGPQRKERAISHLLLQSPSDQDLTCVVDIIPVSEGKEMKAQRISNNLRELVKFMDDVAGMV